MMKPSLAFLIVVLGVSAYAQGTVWFINLDSQHGLNAPVYAADGVTKLAGSQFMAELLAGPSPSSLSSIATTGFLEGGGAGYFNGGIWSLANVAPGQVASVQLRGWNTLSGPSYVQAQASGLPNSWWQSPVLSVVTGGLTSGTGQTPPAFLTGLNNSTLLLNPVPEPTSLALAAVGAVVLRLRLRTWLRIPKQRRDAAATFRPLGLKTQNHSGNGRFRICSSVQRLTPSPVIVRPYI